MTIKDKTTLNNGIEMPWLGLGTWRVKDEATLDQAVKVALDTGYISIDTAAAYGNEDFLGRTLKSTGVSRDELFITTKLWNRQLVDGYDASIKACKDSLKRLQLDYLDLYLIHWPVPKMNKYTEGWKALIKLREEGLVRSIGVSNFHIHHLKEIEEATGVIPAVNQVELHPWLTQKELIAYCQEKGIQVEAYSPLMGGKLGEEEALSEIAAAYGKTPAQIVLRWHLQNKIIIIPKSVHDYRIRENADLYDFELKDSDMKRIDALNRNYRFLPDPDEMDFYK